MNANNDIPIAAGAGAGAGGPPGGGPPDGGPPGVAAGAPAAAPNPFANYQWRVTFYEEGDEPHVEIMSTFSSAWALAQPWPEEMAMHDWSFVLKEDARARFTFAAQNPDSPNADRLIRVCWADDENGTYNTIEMF